MSERVTVDRKEFEAFLSDNQALLERSQKLIEKIDSLERMDRQLREELKASKEKLESLEATVNISKSQSDEALRRARETMARLARETEKRISK
jgi:predicted  nucleic acid-binding Zn-ribbon protein